MYIVLLLFSTLASSGQILINVILPKFLIDELLGARQNERLLLFGAIIVLANFFFAWLTMTMKRVMDEKGIYMREMMNHLMSEKIMKVEYSYLENPYYLDLKERAVFASNNQSAMENLILSVGKLFNSIVTLIGLLVVMFSLSLVLVLFLLITIVITFVAQKKFMKYQQTFFSEIIPVNRKYGYYVGLAYDNKLQKDIRLYGMSPMLTKRVRQYNDEINEWFTKFHTAGGNYGGFLSIINDLQAALVYGYVGLRVITNWFGSRIGIGSFTMYVSAAIKFTSSVSTLGEQVMSVTQYLSYLHPFMEFMELPEEEKVGGDLPFEGNVETIRFEHVTFKYPGSEKQVLKDISFEINKGEKISIVGLNGAGKTTLIKLLCRLYRPTEGKIFINGHDIFEYEHRSYMKSMAAVFQDYRLFAFTMEENITCKEPQEDIKQASELLDKVGLTEKVKTLPNGIKSLFGKSYDEEGIEMSGGESQKVAIARALNKEASLIILDEPTSALDPLAEAEIYENFNHLVGDKTALYISHRMSSSVFCDKILVIDGGVISDYDSHTKLMEKQDSLYYKLFHSQAINYSS
ncbi:ABC transporter ATP-binding protein [Lachnoclostridium sp.]|nr:ABC transporter ATP-binding protein [Lachnoclostridium sp.]